MRRPLRWNFRGNFQPDLPVGVEPWSTETHLTAALERIGHEVVRIQEDRVGWAETVEACEGADVFLWTSTFGMAQNWDQAEAHAAVRTLSERLPTVGYHLDRWWGLDRADQIPTQPFFRLSLLCTADGGHDDEWRRFGVNHVWFSPAVLLAECERTPRPRRDYAHDVAFVGSWQSYHPEWRYRRDLVVWLQMEYRRRIGVYPRGKAIRGQELTDLYNAAKVIVGDSCLAPAADGGPAKKYWSDRVAETLGRGGFLIHPWVEGLEDHYTDGEHLVLYELGDFNGLRKLIDRYVEDDSERDRIRKAGQAHVMDSHVYEVRMASLVDLLYARGLL